MLTEGFQTAPRSFILSRLFGRTNERKRTEVLLETFIRKQLRLKAHTVTKVEETDEFMIVSIDRPMGPRTDEDTISLLRRR